MSTTTTEPGPLTDGTAAFPRYAPVTGPSGEVRWDSLVYSCEYGYRPLFLDLRVPSSASLNTPAPLVIWVHGGGWVTGSRRRRAPNLHQNGVIESIVNAGYAVALVDYRLAKEAAFPAQLLDLKAAVRWLRGHALEYSLDSSRFVVWGESAGGHLAMMLGFCGKDPGPRTGEFHDEPEDLQGVVDWYGPADLSAPPIRPAIFSSAGPVVMPGDPVQEFVESSTWSAAEMSPINYVDKASLPVFIAHGVDDSQVDVSQSRQLHDSLTRAGADTEYLETGGGHVFVGKPVLQQVTEASLTFLRERIGSALTNDLDPAIQAMEKRMAGTGDFPIFTDVAGHAVDGPTARERGVRLRDSFYPRQFFDVESITESTFPGPAGDVRIRIQKPHDASDATVVYFHGGGWIIGDLDSHEGNASRIAARTGAHVVQVDYRLAPENPHPAGVEDAIAAVEWVAAHIDRFGGNPEKLVVAGDSAGGNLAAIAAHHCRDTDVTLAAQLLIYPATDFTLMAGTVMEHQYLGPDPSIPLDDPTLSPALAASLAGLPHTIIGVGEHDFLYQDNLHFAQRLKDSGVDVTLRCYPTLNHGFFSYGNVSTSADRAADEICEDLRIRLSR
ncbi:alpha/beta hydrolase fold domain-containing protein [Arthrobacter sp. 31Y]|uniref:alpha/beta hydrolase fold domain-containing protein n=1 Tax=Arthrobacter sp. 31Y TaxID=1115632 RepID=UPI0004AF3D17|nr:alpha/beta hydrolase fold domain-containing protein [Arthrobacter sp. 31Y]